MAAATYFIVKTLTQLYLLLLLLRFWLPFLRGDFRNPIAQGILRFTSPVIVPLRRFLPSIRRIDTATVVVAFILQVLALLLLLSIGGTPVQPFAFAVPVTAIIELIILSLNLFFFATLIRIILSWIAPGNYNPVTALLTTLSEPILRPFRRFIPPFGGLDISPVFALILLQAVVIFLHTVKPVHV